VDSRHHHDGILDFKIDSGHWRSGHYCMQSGLSVLRTRCTNVVHDLCSAEPRSKVEPSSC